ncbi:MAG: 3-dehydroquinate dehydratase [Bacteroidales bacterium]|nr:MAG: 3-dehydroquinate dehydratase [Bacteroidales bacterium]
MKIQIINGPSLNLIGKRQTDLYGVTSFDEFLEKLKTKYSDIQIDYFQSNVEGEIINKIHEVGFSYDGIVINAGGYTHTSVSIADAISAVEVPVAEVHITNILGRDEYRHVSFIANACLGSIMGFGLDSYRLGIEAILEIAS